MRFSMRLALALALGVMACSEASGTALAVTAARPGPAVAVAAGEATAGLMAATARSFHAPSKAFSMPLPKAVAHTRSTPPTERHW